MDRIEAIRTFMAAAETGSLTAAATSGALPLSTVSRRVAALERQIGLPLFRRTARKLVLTEAGQAYLEGARRILADLDGLDASVAGRHAARSGLVTLTAPVAFGRLHVLPLVTDYLVRYPETRIRLLLLDRVVDLLEEGVDLAVRFGPAPEALVARRFGEERHVVCASPAYLAGRQMPRSPEDLAGHDTIATSPLDMPAWRFAGGLTVRVRPRLSVGTAEAAVDAAVTGLGITRVMAYQAADAIASGRLVRILAPFEPEPTPGHLIYAGGGFVPARIRAVVADLLPRLRARQVG